MSVAIEWLETSSGRSLLREESDQVLAALESVFGDHLVQIGRWGSQDLFLQHGRTRFKSLLSWKAGDRPDAVVCPDALGISSDCVDAVLLPHVLETAADPIAVLREVDRVLRPEGHIIVLGFNPVSWWGLRHRLSRPGFPPGIQRHIPVRRLSDWLRLLNFRISHSAGYYRVAPISPPPSRQPVSAFQAWRNWRAFMAGYILVACKELFTLTLVRPDVRRRASLVGGLVNPTTRNAA